MNQTRPTRPPARPVGRWSSCTATCLCVLLGLALWGGMAVSLQAVPASPEPLRVAQPDGRTITVYLRGDEHLHWHEDDQGFTILQDAAKGFWHYAEQNGAGQLVSSKHRVGETDPAQLGLPRRLLAKGALEAAKAERAAKQHPLHPILKKSSNPTSSGEQLRVEGGPRRLRHLVILVDFPDLPARYPRENFVRFFNEPDYSDNGAKGSVRDYYREVSYGQLDLEAVVTDWIRLPYSYAWYGEGYKDDLTRLTLLIAQAYIELERRGFDFNSVDRSDGRIADMLTVVHAGPGESDRAGQEYIWSKAAWLQSPSIDQRYAIVEEQKAATRDTNGIPTSFEMAGIGTTCHEIGHLLDLPDLYDPDGSSSGVGPFCLMGNGNHNGKGKRPAHLSAWCKARLGWVSPTPITRHGIYQLPQAASSPMAYRMNVPGAPQEYFLLENRQNAGFDTDLAWGAGGILIWHVDEAVPDNRNEHHYLLDLEEASGTQDLESRNGFASNSDYFRFGNKVRFGRDTNPNNLSYGGLTGGLQIVDVSASGPMMTFSVSESWVGEALDAPGMRWSPASSDEEDWLVVTNVTHDGADAASSSLIGHNQASTLRSWVQSPGVLSFWWRTDTETNDVFSLLADGAQVARATGAPGAWQFVQIKVPEKASGLTELNWTFRRDWSGGRALEQVWLDEVRYLEPTNAPILLTQPQGQRVVAGANVSLSVEAVGWSPVLYQWFRNGVRITGATNPELTMLNVQPAQSGNYRVVVSQPLRRGGLDGVIFSPTNYSLFRTNQSVIAQLTVDSPGSLVESPALNWTTCGHTPWIGDTNYAHAGPTSIRSGAMPGYSQQARESVLETEVVGPGDISFWWRRSTNFGGSARFEISGVDQGTFPNVAWEQRTFPIPTGRQTLRWIFTRYANDATPETNAVWLDEVVCTALPFTNVVSVPDAVEAANRPWRFSGNAAWRGQTQVTLDREDAAEARLGEGNHEAVMETDVTGPRLVTFYWQTDPDASPTLRAYRNGTKLIEERDVSFWQTHRIAVPSGTHTLRWSASGGGTAWLDRVVVDFMEATTPFITIHPRSIGVSEGVNFLPGLALTVEASGAEPMSYYWYFNETNLINTPSDPTLDLRGINTLAQAGSYTVVVSNVYGMQRSQPATLRVWPSVTWSQQSVFNTGGSAISVQVVSNLAYVANGAAGLLVLDVTNPGQIRALGAFDTPSSAMDVAVAWPFAYVADYNGGLQILDVRNPAQISRAVVFYPGGTPDYNSVLEVEVFGSRAYLNDSSFGVFSLDVSTPANPVRLGSRLAYWPYMHALGDRVVADYGSGNRELFDTTDGSFQSLGGFGSYPEAFMRFPEGANRLFTKGPAGSLMMLHPKEVATPLVFQAQWNQLSAWDTREPDGAVQVMNYSLAGNSAPGKLALAGDAVLVPVGTSGLEVIRLANMRPVITTQPQSVATNEDAVVSFSVGAAATYGPLTYQWYRDRRAIASAINASWVLSNVQVADDGFYEVVVANSFGSATSALAGLTVPLTLSHALDVPGQYFQTNGWYPRLVPQTSRTHDGIDALELGVEGLLSDQTETAELYTFFPDPVIVSFWWRMSCTSTSGLPCTVKSNTLTFTGGTEGSISISGDTPWQQRRVPMQNGTASWIYRDSIGPEILTRAWLDEVVITPATSPLFANPLVNQSVPVGSNAVLVAEVAGYDPLGYQWYRNGELIPNQTGRRLTLSNLQLDQSAAYFVIATNTIGRATSSVAQVSVYQPRIVNLLRDVGLSGFNCSRFSVGPDHLVSVLDPLHDLFAYNAKNQAQINLAGYHTNALEEFSAVAVNADRVFVATRSGSLILLDKSNFWGTDSLGRYQSGAFELTDVEVAGDLIYLAGFKFDGDEETGWIEILQLTAPANFTRVAAFNTAGRITGLHLQNSRLYVADERMGLQIYSVTNPATPSLLGKLGQFSRLTDVTVVGTRAFVLDRTAGLGVVDVNDPALPTMLGNLPLPGLPTHLAINGSLAFIAAGDTGLLAVDVSTPERLQMVYRSPAGSVARDVAVQENRVYQLTGDGFQILTFDIAPPPGYMLTLSTNPVSGGGSIQVNPPPDARGQYTNGTQVTLTAIPTTGMVFSNWTGSFTSTNNPLVVTMNSNLSLTAAFAPASVFTTLVTNLARLASPGAVGAVVSTIPANDPWQLIVSGDEDTTAPSSFCLARTYGSGRVVALGHDGIMLENVYDNAQFHRNVARWLNQARPRRIAFSTGHGEFVRLDNSTAFNNAVAGEFSETQLPAPITSTALASVDVLVLGNAWGTFTSSEVAAVQSFVNNGGGLLLVGVGWAWMAYHPGTTMADFPMAQIATPYGVTWADNTMSDPTDNSAGSPIFHQFYPNTFSGHFPGPASAPSVNSIAESAMATADVLYAEARVEQSTPGTFFSVLVGEAFYFGLQEGGSGYAKHVHFAVWDPADNSPWTAPGVNKTRFSGEGTGWTTYYPFNWREGVTYRFCAQILRENPSNTLYLAYFHDPGAGTWKHLATIRRTIGVPGLNRLGSFVEDFGQRNWVARSFLVGNQWARVAGGQWLDLRQALFDCSLGWSNPYTNNYDGDVVGAAFRLETGGLTVRDNARGEILLRDPGQRTSDLPSQPPTVRLIGVPGGPLQIGLRGIAGLDYVVQVSSDLANWTNLGTVTATSSEVAIGDPNPSVVPRRFYRAKLATGM